jgi:lipoprotein-anchoring transpeptidase ErfK/SrfK
MVAAMKSVPVVGGYFHQKRSSQTWGNWRFCTAIEALCLAGFLLAFAVPARAREIVDFPEPYPPNTIIIKEAERRLYWTTGAGTAIRYPIAVGKAGRSWQGETSVSGKYLAPDWTPPADVRHDHPHFPALIPGGSPRNPMGAAAITLRLSEVAIHGTTRGMRRSVGTAASYGCIRMYNEDVLDLFKRVRVGTRVIAVP